MRINLYKRNNSVSVMVNIPKAFIKEIETFTDIVGESRGKRQYVTGSI